jgi:hypothetical protein
LAALESAEGDGAVEGRDSIVVGQVVGVDADVVGVGIVEEADGFDVVEARQESLADAVHTVHDATVAGENDRIGEGALVDEAGVADNFAASQFFRVVAAPIGFVQFANGGEWHADSWEGAGQIDETTDVPGAEALG